MVKTFRNLRDNPPRPFRSAFFPASRAEIKAKTRGSPALLRPVLKTDQGTAGNFLGFRINNQTDFSPFLITQETGLAVPETYFLRELERHEGLCKTTFEIQELFAQDDEDKAYLALEKLTEECQVENVVFQRTVDKGRIPFFFIRPVQSQEGPVILPNFIAEQIEKEVKNLILELENRAQTVKNLVREGFSLEEASNMAKSSSLKNEDNVNILYFQPDVIIRSDGSFIIDRINIPDVVFFLTQIDSFHNPVFSKIQNVVEDLKIVVLERVVKQIKEIHKDEITIITRDGVIDNEEDTLEHFEIRDLAKSLGEFSINTNIVRLSDVNNVPSGSFLMLLNISAYESGFENLLSRSSRDEIICYPDPFIILFKDNFHTYPKVYIQGEQIENLRAILEPLSLDENHPELVYRQLLALQHYLSELGFNQEDFFYLTNSKGIIAPAFRYDLKGFALALNEFSTCSIIEIRGLSYKVNDALVRAKDGSRLSAFRFMFVRS